MARLLLGLEPGLDPFASQAGAGRVTRRSRGAGSRSRSARCRTPGPTDADCRDLLDALARPPGSRSLTSAASPPSPSWPGRCSPHCRPPPTAPADATPARIAAGLLRLALDRAQALNRADAGDEPAHPAPPRRQDRAARHRPRPARPGRGAGPRSRRPRRQARAAGEPLVPGARAAERLQATWARAVSGPGAAPRPPGGSAAAAGRRAGQRSRPWPGPATCITATCLPATALGIALKGVGGAQPVTAQEVRDRVRAKFPALPPLPDRPRLDQLVSDAGLDLVYDETERAYRSPDPRRGHHRPGLPARHVQRPPEPEPAGRRPGRAAAGRRAPPRARSSRSASTRPAPTGPSTR